MEMRTLASSVSVGPSPASLGGQAGMPSIAQLTATKAVSVEEVLDLESLVEDTELIFKLLQLACEDFFFEFKEYVREQPDSLHPVNMVRQGALTASARVFVCVCACVCVCVL
jgi:hypothetical protein